MTTHSSLYDAVKRGVSAKLSPAELGSEATARHTWCCVWDGPTWRERSEPGQTCARVRSARLVPALLAAEPVPRWFGRGASIQGVLETVRSDAHHGTSSYTSAPCMAMMSRTCCSAMKNSFFVINSPTLFLLGFGGFHPVRSL